MYVILYIYIHILATNVLLCVLQSLFTKWIYLLQRVQICHISFILSYIYIYVPFIAYVYITYHIVIYFICHHHLSLFESKKNIWWTLKKQKRAQTARSFCQIAVADLPPITPLYPLPPNIVQGVQSKFWIQNFQ